MSAAPAGPRAGAEPGRWTAMLLTGGFLVAVFGFFAAPSEGLMPLWLAGRAIEAGQSGQVYVAAVPFAMRPPADWPALMAAQGYRGPIGAYLHPPLWAALAGLLRGADFWRFSSEALVITAALTMGAVWLAISATRPRFAPALHALGAVLLLLWTPAGALALLRADPAIVTGFLLVLAFERSRAGAEIAGGAALGAAVAWAVWPLLLVPLVLAGGARRGAAVALAVPLAALAVSLAWLGGAVHAAFVDQGLALWRSVVCGPASASVDCVLGGLFAPGAFQRLAAIGGGPAPPPAAGWAAMARPLIWQLASLAVLAAALTWLTAAWARADAVRRALLWPMACAVCVLILPAGNAWGFLPLFAFAPLLADRLGPAAGGATCLAAGIVLFTPFTRALAAVPAPGGAIPASALAVFVGIVVLVAGFAAAHRRWRLKASQPRIA